MRNNTQLTRRNLTVVLLMSLLTIVIALNLNEETKSNTAEAKPMSAMSSQKTVNNNTGILNNPLVEETHVFGEVEGNLISILPVFTTYEQKAAAPVAPVSKDKETNVTKVTSPPTQTTTKVEETKENKTFKVTAEYLNVRANAYNGSKIIDILKKDDVLEISSIHHKRGDWVRLKDGGYVHSKYIVPTTESATINVKPVATATTKKQMEVKKLSISSSSEKVKTKTSSDKPANPVSVGVDSPSNLTVEDVEKILEGTALGGREIAEAIIAIEEEHNVNAFFTIAVAKLESGNGKSKLAKNKNNLFGLNATGDVYKNANSYDTKADSVYDFGRIIEKGYINKGLTTVTEINKKYCPPNPKWKNLVSDIIKGDMKKL